METARRHYPRTTLFTDSAGARMLVEGMGLEFTHVSTDLDSLDKYDPEWWTLGKIYTYRAQHSPFVHIDNDVFLWNRLPPRMENAPLFAQNPEPFVVGESAWYMPQKFESLLLAKECGWLPREWLWYRLTSGAQQKGINCGVFGGQRLDFIQYYADLAIRTIDHPPNEMCAALDAKVRHTVSLEQYVLSACVEFHRANAGSGYEGVEIEYLFESLSDAYHRGDDVGFTHLLGDLKSSADAAERIERKVRHLYPRQYERCLRYLSDAGL